MLPSLKLGIIVDTLSNYHFGIELTKNLNQLIVNHPEIDVIVFRDDPSLLPTETPKFAIMHIKETWRYDGVLISTNMMTTEVLIKSPCTKHKFFYCWDLEWLYQERPTYSYLQNIYNNPNIPLIARNEEYSKTIQNIWRKPYCTIQEFNHEQLFKLFERTRLNQGENVRLLS